MRTRMICMIVAALVVLTAPLSAAAEPSYLVRGDWIVQADRDRFSGANNVVAARVAPDMTALLVRCLDRRLSLVVKGFDRAFAGETEMFAVIFRADDASPVMSLAEALDDNTAQIFVRDGMVQQMLVAKEIAFRFKTTRTRFDRIFATGRGVQAAVTEVTKACPSP